MDTVRVDVAYRPIRLAWAVHSEDLDSLRKVVRLTNTLWGGRFNPIVFVDQPHEAQQIIEAFRADLIWPIGDREEVSSFKKLFPHLIDPLHGRLFLTGLDKRGARNTVLDIQNALVHWRNSGAWKFLDEAGIRIFEWNVTDPLADVFLMQYGDYPDAKEIGLDYKEILRQATPAMVETIANDCPLSDKTLDHPSISYISRHLLERHYTFRPNWDAPGFFIGDASNILDLALFWNLRAADIRLQFIDPSHMHRFESLIPKYHQRLVADLSHRAEHERSIAIWARSERVIEAAKLFPEYDIATYSINGEAWNGYNLRPPMMVLGEETSLGISGKAGEAPRVSFALQNRPYCADPWFFNQHLIASVSVVGGLYGDDQHTFQLPYMPEANEFFARSLLYDYSKFRIEPERLGIIITASDHDAFLNALPADKLFERILDQAGAGSRLSGGGLITRQLLVRLGGVSGARVFKIPGVRRLLRTFGPTASFTKKSGHQLIAQADPQRPDSGFSDHKQLYIEPRSGGGDLTPQMVFGYLVEKGLFRIGAQLTCPSCRLAAWVALDNLKQQMICELCGSAYDATRQLVNGEYHYRRTGVLGLEKNTQGAVPVVLVLEQLTRAFGYFRGGNVYTPSIDIFPKHGCELPVCEIDFAMIVPGSFPSKASLVLGECKDEGPIDSKDIENLSRIAGAIPQHRFDVYIVLAKMADFSVDEIELAKSLNGPLGRRAILLTSRDLEPFYIETFAKIRLGDKVSVNHPKDLAQITHDVYFREGELKAVAGYD